MRVLLWSWNFNIAIRFNSCMLKFVDISATTLTLEAGLEIKKYISNVIEKIKDQSKSPNVIYSPYKTSSYPCLTTLN